MAKNVSLLGANYPDVPAVDLPQTGGGTARFTDVSGTTATTDDVVSGKTFFGANGSAQQGNLIVCEFLADYVNIPFSISANSTFNANMYNEANVKQGYTPIGIVGFAVNNNTTMVCNCTFGGNNYGLYLKNTTSADVTGTFSASILYKKN